MHGQSGVTHTRPIEGGKVDFLPPDDHLDHAVMLGVLGVGRRDSPRQISSREVEKLVSANRRKDDFLATVCHELRSPLTSLRYAVRLLRNSTRETPLADEMQALIERQVQHMSSLVDDLLDVTRIANGRMQLHLERVDLRLVVNNAIQTLAPDIAARHHQLTTAAPDEPVWLMADPLRLEQVFVNLLGNAVKYTESKGQLALWVHVRATQAIVRIRDSGRGIAPQLLPHVFDLFRQADGSDTQSGSGLGIGLAVVRNLVQLHGGSVNATSGGCGKGSEFTVRLPRAY